MSLDHRSITRPNFEGTVKNHVLSHTPLHIFLHDIDTNLSHYTIMLSLAILFQRCVYIGDDDYGWTIMLAVCLYA